MMALCGEEKDSGQDGASRDDTHHRPRRAVAQRAHTAMKMLSAIFALDVPHT